MVEVEIRLTPDQYSREECHREAIAKILKVGVSRLVGMRLRRRTIDARQPPPGVCAAVYSLDRQPASTRPPI
jgi:hypothetical protein